jgi:hypothetical protein
MGFLDSMNRANPAVDPADSFDRTNINSGIFQARKAIKEALHRDSPFLADNNFQAIALWVSSPTTTMPIMSEQQSNPLLEIGSLNPNIENIYTTIPKMRIKVYFRVPVMHANLPLPDNFQPTQANAFSKLNPAARTELLISCHPHLYADYEFFSEITPGDQIKIRFDDKTYSSAQIIKIEKKSTNNIDYNISPAKVLGAAADVASYVIDLFDDAAEALLLGTSFEPSTPEEIKKLALSYDEDDTIPRKDRYLPEVNRAHPEMIPYIKAYIYKAWTELGATIKVNSTYRSPRVQQGLIDDWVAAGGEKSGKVKPASAGTSWHNVGGALDHNPILKSGVTLGVGFPEKDRELNRAMWKESGLVALGESLGLNWGGHWESPYDPIHFDLGAIFTSGQKNELLKKSIAQGVEPTSIEFV